MQNVNRTPHHEPSAAKRRKTPFGTSASLLTMAALLVPGLAIAENAVNNATVSVPAGVIDPDMASNSFTDTDNLTVSALSAVADTVSGINGASGATAVANAFTGDMLNGVAASASNTTLSVTTGTTVPAGLTFNTTTGAVDVAAGTPAGTYVVNYTICETLNPSNCQNSTITVNVAASTLVATPDVATAINGVTGTPTALSLFTGDQVNGMAATATNSTLSIAPGSSLPPVLTFDPATGVVGVNPGTPAGTYSFTYQICETLNPGNCTTATASVTVDAAALVAGNDTVSGINGASGATAVANAFTSDTVNGLAASPSNATLSVTPGTTIPAGLTFNTATGSVDVAAGTPAGTYVVNYTICETLNPTNCQNATITVNVAPAALAVTGQPTAVTGGVGTTTPVDLLGAITINGGPATPTEVITTVTVPAVPQTPGAPVPVVDPATGIATIPPGTPAGPYPISYSVCERLNPTNCVTTTVTVNVLAGTLTLSPDVLPSINGATGGVTGPSVFTNDMLNGVAVTPATTTVTVTTPATAINGGPVPTLNPETGLVTVAPGTPAGTYNVVYQVCETLNPTNCATQTATVVVTAPVLELGPDPVIPVRQGIGGTNIANVLTNDTLNGVALTPGSTTLTVVAPAAHAGVTLNPATGQVSVGPDVPAGTYVIEYQVCETLNPTNCQTNRVQVLVEAPISAVSGTVFSDRNGNGILDPNEPRRQGWVVELVRNGQVVATATTDVNGNYRFDGVASGPGYEIVFRNPENNVVYERIGGLTLGNNVTIVDQNQPIDPSGVIYDSVTRNLVSGATVRLLDAQGNALPAACFISASQQSQTTGASGQYRFDIVPGAAAQCPLSQSVYHVQVITPAGYSAPSTVIVPRSDAFDPTGMAGPVRIAPTDGAPTEALPVYYLQFALQTGDPDVIFNHIPIDPFLTRTPLTVTKTSIKRTANTGDLVPYEITVRNTENAQRSGVSVVDILPPGMKYVLGTASVNGVPSEPEASDRQVTWRGQIIPANGSVRYNLTLVVGAGVSGGEKVNTGLAQTDANGAAISNRGTAVVSIVPSAVFDCSELLGKVFEDANRNGYQDQGELGVPGARLVTVNGQQITTDEHGRYHIACAAVPDARLGSNYVLKLDTRTLPLGWDVTTDNPRSIRLTRGKFGELNFGVAPATDAKAPGTGGSTPLREKGE